MSEYTTLSINPDLALQSEGFLTGFSTGFELARQYHEGEKTNSRITRGVTERIKKTLLETSLFDLGEEFTIDVPFEFRQMVAGAYAYADQNGIRKSDPCVTKVKQRVLMGYRNGLKLVDTHIHGDWKVSVKWQDKEGILLGMATFKPDEDDEVIIPEGLQELAEQMVALAEQSTNDKSRAKKAIASVLATSWATR